MPTFKHDFDVVCANDHEILDAEWGLPTVDGDRGQDVLYVVPCSRCTDEDRLELAETVCRALARFEDLLCGKVEGGVGARAAADRDWKRALEDWRNLSEGAEEPTNGQA